MRALKSTHFTVNSLYRLSTNEIIRVTAKSPVGRLRAERREYCTPLRAPARSGDDALVTRGSVALKNSKQFVRTRPGRLSADSKQLTRGRPKPSISNQVGKENGAFPAAEANKQMAATRICTGRERFLLACDKRTASSYCRVFPMASARRLYPIGRRNHGELNMAAASRPETCETLTKDACRNTHLKTCWRRRNPRHFANSQLLQCNCFCVTVRAKTFLRRGAPVMRASLPFPSRRGPGRVRTCGQHDPKFQPPSKQEVRRRSTYKGPAHQTVPFFYSQTTSEQLPRQVSRVMGHDFRLAEEFLTCAALTEDDLLRGSMSTVDETSRTVETTLHNSFNSFFQKHRISKYIQKYLNPPPRVEVCYRYSINKVVVPHVDAARPEHCTSVPRSARSGDVALDARGTVACIAPGLLCLELGNRRQLDGGEVVDRSAPRGGGLEVKKRVPRQARRTNRPARAKSNQAAPDPVYELPGNLLEVDLRRQEVVEQPRVPHTVKDFGEYGAAPEYWGGGNEDARENQPTSTILRDDSHTRKSRSEHDGNRTLLALVGGEWCDHFTTAAPNSVRVKLRTGVLGTYFVSLQFHRATSAYGYEWLCQRVSHAVKGYIVEQKNASGKISEDVQLRSSAGRPERNHECWRIRAITDEQTLARPNSYALSPIRAAVMSARCGAGELGCGRVRWARNSWSHFQRRQRAPASSAPPSASRRARRGRDRKLALQTGVFVVSRLSALQERSVQNFKASARLTPQMRCGVFEIHFFLQGTNIKRPTNVPIYPKNTHLRLGLLSAFNALRTLETPYHSTSKWLLFKEMYLNKNTLDTYKKWSSAGMQGRGKWKTPEKTIGPVASPGAIPSCESESDPGGGGIEPGSPCREASSLTAQPPWPHKSTRGRCIEPCHRLSAIVHLGAMAHVMRVAVSPVSPARFSASNAENGTRQMDPLIDTNNNSNNIQKYRVSLLKEAPWDMVERGNEAGVQMTPKVGKGSGEDMLRDGIDTGTPLKDSSSRSWDPMRVIEVNMEQRRNKGAGEMGDSREKTRLPTASSGTIPTCENPVTRPGIEPDSPWWEASVLIAQPPAVPYLGENKHVSSSYCNDCPHMTWATSNNAMRAWVVALTRNLHIDAGMTWSIRDSSPTLSPLSTPTNRPVLNTAATLYPRAQSFMACRPFPRPGVHFLPHSLDTTIARAPFGRFLRSVLCAAAPARGLLEQVRGGGEGCHDRCTPDRRGVGPSRVVSRQPSWRGLAVQCRPLGTPREPGDSARPGQPPAARMAIYFPRPHFSCVVQSARAPARQLDTHYSFAIEKHLHRQPPAAQQTLAIILGLIWEQISHRWSLPLHSKLAKLLIYYARSRPPVAQSFCAGGSGFESRGNFRLLRSPAKVLLSAGILRHMQTKINHARELHQSGSALHSDQLRDTSAPEKINDKLVSQIMCEIQGCPSFVKINTEVTFARRIRIKTAVVSASFDVITPPLRTLGFEAGTFEVSAITIQRLLEYLGNYVLSLLLAPPGATSCNSEFGFRVCVCANGVEIALEAPLIQWRAVEFLQGKLVLAQCCTHCVHAAGTTNRSGGREKLPLTTAATHESAARHPLHLCCDVKWPSTFKWPMFTLANCYERRSDAPILRSPLMLVERRKTTRPALYRPVSARCFDIVVPDRWLAEGIIAVGLFAVVGAIPGFPVELAKVYPRQGSWPAHSTLKIRWTDSRVVCHVPKHVSPKLPAEISELRTCYRLLFAHSVVVGVTFNLTQENCVSIAEEVRKSSRRKLEDARNLRPRAVGRELFRVCILPVGEAYAAVVDIDVIGLDCIQRQRYRVVSRPSSGERSGEPSPTLPPPTFLSSKLREDYFFV
ncbi:hypothetical protein PR048_018993 [Dryococelus australis]|uniref:Uncharacterized protein n=1 Tax=Dryococelus australis TaxID=614101 RepID=A0ABQ9H287_9NEOP|nr:hypothetical protein PR048_018993 [Dryococelus australis]